MQMLLKGDYFNGRFSHPEGTSALVGVQEKILKKCPGELTLNLWEAGVYYEHTEKVIEFPASSAERIWPFAKWHGKLNGPITKHGPSGL